MIFNLNLLVFQIFIFFLASSALYFSGILLDFNYSNFLDFMVSNKDFSDSNLSLIFLPYSNLFIILYLKNIISIKPL
jgi:hypothetical protein